MAQSFVSVPQAGVIDFEPPQPAATPHTLQRNWLKSGQPRVWRVNFLRQAMSANDNTR